ncbi:hypothetical protein BFP78_08535 [Gaetbulibacter sp. 5U11]|nr:hypothetical protein BFP78_08535 [Gaetbulibacter sp. 5U11]
MSIKKLVTYKFKKNTTVFDLLFFVFFFIAITLSITLAEKKNLIYISPIVILTIIIKYFSVTKKKADPLFLIALLAFLFLNVISFYAYIKYLIPLVY